MFVHISNKPSLALWDILLVYQVPWYLVVPHTRYNMAQKKIEAK